AVSEINEQPPAARTKGRLFVVATPSAADLVRAANIPAGQCPRRYWWWRSLNFEWQVTASEGCTFLASAKPPGLPTAAVPCCRCDGTSSVDHYEPREPHLLGETVLPSPGGTRRRTGVRMARSATTS